MELWYSIIIGTVIFAYIHSFNRIMKLHLAQDGGLTLGDMFTKIIPISQISS
jgi:hypothetical protein